MKRDMRPTSQAAINSASVTERAIVGWNLVFYAMVPPVSWMQISLKEQRVLTQVAQSKLP